MVMIALDEPLPEPSQRVCIESSSSAKFESSGLESMVWGA
jgi:hypothetical protein